MGTNNRESLLLKAWVRYDGNGEIIPGSIVYRKRKPAGKFKELIDPSSYDPCCPVVYSTTAVPACGEDGYWVDEITTIGSTNQTSNSLLYINKVGTVDCNYFTLATDNNPNVKITFPSGQREASAMVIKYNSDGTKDWEKAVALFTSDENYNYVTYSQSFTQDKEGNTYLLFVNLYEAPEKNPMGVVKLDPTGAVVWARMYNKLTAPNNIYCKAIKINPIDGYLYIAAGFESVAPEEYETNTTAGGMIKMNPVSGDIEISKAYYSLLPAIYNTDVNVLEQFELSQFDFTPEGDIVLSVGIYLYQEVPEYKDYYPMFVIKLDKGLNVIWANYGELSPYDRCVTSNCNNGYADLELMSVQVDRFGYIYGNGWGQDIIKLNPDGTLNLQYFLTTDYYTTPYDYIISNSCTRVDGDTLWTVGYVGKNYVTGNPADSDTQVILVTNMDLYGNMRWSTFIEGSYPQNYVFTNNEWSQSATAKNGVLYFNVLSWDYTTNPYNFTFAPIKLSSTQQTGTYSTFTLTDVTSVINVYKPNDLKVSFQNVATEQTSVPVWPLEFTTEVVNITDTSSLTTIP